MLVLVQAEVGEEHAGWQELHKEGAQVCTWGVGVEGIRRCGDRSEVRPTLWIALVLWQVWEPLTISGLGGAELVPYLRERSLVSSMGWQQWNQSQNLICRIPMDVHTGPWFIVFAGSGGYYKAALGGEGDGVEGLARDPQMGCPWAKPHGASHRAAGRVQATAIGICGLSLCDGWLPLVSGPSWPMESVFLPEQDAKGEAGSAKRDVAARCGATAFTELLSWVCPPVSLTCSSALPLHQMCVHIYWHPTLWVFRLFSLLCEYRGRARMSWGHPGWYWRSSMHLSYRQVSQGTKEKWLQVAHIPHLGRHTLAGQMC